MKRLFIGLLIILFPILQGQSPAPQQPPKTVTLTLSVEHAEVVVEALGKLPYEKSAPIIQTIIQQASKQLNPEVPKNNPDSTKIRK